MSLWLKNVKTDQEYQFWHFSIKVISECFNLHGVPKVVFAIKAPTRANCRKPIITLSHFTQRYSICMYAVPFDITLSHFKQRCIVWYGHCAIRHCAKPFRSTLHRMCVHCTIRHYVEAFDATLHRLCTVLQMSAKLFAIELVHFTISCSNST